MQPSPVVSVSTSILHAPFACNSVCVVERLRAELPATRLTLLVHCCRVRCYSFDPYVVSIGAVSGRPIATVIVHRVVLDDYCVLTS